MQRFVAQPQGSKTLQRNSCAMENFQIEQPTSRGTRNGVALGLLGLVAVALLLTPGALTGLAMADGFNGGAHLSASTARVCTTFDLSVVFSAQNATTFAGCSEIVRWGISHRVRCRQARRSLATLALSVPRPLLLSRSSGNRAATDGLEGHGGLGTGREGHAQIAKIRN